MKKIGIVGGMAWTSTVDYYCGICHRCEQRQRTRGPGVLAQMPEIAIESLDLKTAFSYLGNDNNPQSWERFDEYHRAALRRLEASGADFAVIAANSPHHRFDTITQTIEIPVINLLDVVAKAARLVGARKILILGTALAMRSSKFREAFVKRGIDAAGPADESIRASTAALVTDLQLGKLEGAADKVEKIARACLGGSQLDGSAVYLACTELLLAFPGQKDAGNFEHQGIVYLNSTALHIDAAFDFAVSA